MNTTPMFVVSLIRDDLVYVQGVGATREAAIAAINTQIKSIHDDLRKEEPELFTNLDASTLLALPAEAEEGNEFTIFGVGEVVVSLLWHTV